MGVIRGPGHALQTAVLFFCGFSPGLIFAFLIARFGQHRARENRKWWLSAYIALLTVCVFLAREFLSSIQIRGALFFNLLFFLVIVISVGWRRRG